MNGTALRETLEQLPARALGKGVETQNSREWETEDMDPAGSRRYLSP